MKRAAPWLAATGLLGCDGRPEVPVLDGPWARRLSALEAYCEAEVDGTGKVDVESVYLPAVVACENGNADFAALQAQAVAARSYLYYKLDRSGRIGDGQGDQVFTCNRPPGEAHREAVRTTAGQVLMYADAPIAAFYVAGAIPSTDDCRPAPGDRDPTSTERWVTYNEGRSADEVVQTELGFVDPRNFANRGCKSQNGANCLSERGYAWEQIVRFYYGEDIGLLRTDGPCVPSVEPLPDAAPPPPPQDAAPALPEDAEPLVPDARADEVDLALDPSDMGTADTPPDPDAESPMLAGEADAGTIEGAGVRPAGLTSRGGCNAGGEARGGPLSLGALALLAFVRGRRSRPRLRGEK
ncbi:MAG: SpoIID/LytB domain-containing protein [Bradymonadia bacterium]|jgi:hypothetical protein